MAVFFLTSESCFICGKYNVHMPELNEHIQKFLETAAATQHLHYFGRQNYGAEQEPSASA